MDGTPGTNQALRTQIPATSYTTPGQASHGQPALSGTNGADGADGAPGGDGQDAGSIRIYCQRAQKPFDLTLSARGGAAGSPMDGQDGGAASGGQKGADLYQERGELDMPTAGGNGARGGRGGAGAQVARNGSGGTILFEAAQADSPLPVVVKDAVAVGDAGAYGRPGSGGLPGAAGAGGAGGEYWGTNQSWHANGAANGVAGQSDASVHGGVLTTPSGDFYPVPVPGVGAQRSSDVGNLVELGGSGPMYSVKEVTNKTTVQLTDPPPDTTKTSWRLFSITPWSVVPPGMDAPDLPPWSSMNMLRGAGGVADGTSTFTPGAPDPSLDPFIYTKMLSYPCKPSDAGKLMIIPDHGTYLIVGANSDGSVVLDRNVPAGTALRWVRVDGVPAPAKPTTVGQITTTASGSYVNAAALVSDDYLYMLVARAQFSYLALDPKVVAQVATLGSNPDPNDPRVTAATDR